MTTYRQPDPAGRYITRQDIDRAGDLDWGQDPQQAPRPRQNGQEQGQAPQPAQQSPKPAQQYLGLAELTYMGVKVQLDLGSLTEQGVSQLEQRIQKLLSREGWAAAPAGRQQAPQQQAQQGRQQGRYPGRQDGIPAGSRQSQRPQGRQGSRPGVTPAREGGMPQFQEPEYNDQGQECCPMHHVALQGPNKRGKLFCPAKDPQGHNGFCDYFINDWAD